MKELKQGDKFIAQNVKTKLCGPAIVLCKTENLRSYKVKTNSGRYFITNRKFLKPSKISHKYFDDLPDSKVSFNNATSNPISNNVNVQSNASSQTGCIIK